MIKTFFIALIFFFIIDVFWIYFVATPMYKQEVSSLMELKIPPALLFYVIFLLGLIFFVVNPNQDNTLLNVFLIGAFFGLVTYGTYDLTVYASMNIFSLKLVVADILWGMFLSGAVATLTVFTINKLKYKLIFSVNKIFNKGFSTTFYSKTERFISQNDIDCIIIHEPFFLKLSLKFKQKYKLNVIFNAHEYHPLEFEDNPFWKNTLYLLPISL